MFVQFYVNPNSYGLDSISLLMLWILDFKFALPLTYSTDIKIYNHTILKILSMFKYIVQMCTLLDNKPHKSLLKCIGTNTGLSCQISIWFTIMIYYFDRQLTFWSCLIVVMRSWHEFSLNYYRTKILKTIRNAHYNRTSKVAHRCYSRNVYA